MSSSYEESLIRTSSKEPKETRIFSLSFGTIDELSNNKDGRLIVKDTILIKVE